MLRTSLSRLSDHSSNAVRLCGADHGGGGQRTDFAVYMGRGKAALRDKALRAKARPVFSSATAAVRGAKDAAAAP